MFDGLLPSTSPSLSPFYDPSNDPLYARQVAMEEEMTSAGKARLEAAVNAARAEKRESETHAGSRLLTAAVVPLAEAIKAYVEGSNTGKAGRRQAAAGLLEGMDPLVVAYITARSSLDRIGGQCPLTRLAVMVGNSVEDEARFCAYKGIKPEEFAKTEKNLKGTTHKRHRTRVMVYQMNKQGIEWAEWDEKLKVQLGMRLVELFSEATGLVEIKQGENSQYIVIPTPKTLEWIEKANARHALMCPVYLPCIIPPKPWTTPTDGGYHTQAVRRLSIVKTRNKGLLEEMFSSDLTQVYSALNALQSTAWRINSRVLEVAKHMWDNGLGLGSVLPAREGADVPAKPGWLAARPKGDKTEMTEAQKADFTTWKAEAAAAHKRFAKSVSRRMQTNSVLTMAERFAPEEAIYFPYNSDFRGRVYAQVSFLSPQGNDLAKGLLTFANGKAIGDNTGPGWLAIHGANSYGFDKATLDERIAWVEEHEAAILESAADPLSTSFWQDADSPWCFLAFCHEWAGYKAEGAAFVSCLPVALDGSCNGIQHFSAMLRDPVGGAAVNLVPGERPNDIYRAVAEATTAHLRLLADTCVSTDEGKLAAMWLAFGIDRKITKRSVMVLPYGGTYMSCKSYVEEAVLEKGNPPVDPKDRKAFATAIHFLAKAVWQSIGVVVIGARECMSWLQACTRLAAKTELPINWTAPSGWRVQQAYREQRKDWVKVQLWGQLVKVAIYKETPQLNASRQVTGVAPNFVHSMDAAALVKCVNLSVDNGLTEFAMIHDSYGTLAADTDMLGACLRRAFVDMYRDNDVLTSFRDSIIAMLPPDLAAKVPPLPERGALDLDAIMQSDFFFA